MLPKSFVMSHPFTQVEETLCDVRATVNLCLETVQKINVCDCLIFAITLILFLAPKSRAHSPSKYVYAQPENFTGDAIYRWIFYR